MSNIETLLNLPRDERARRFDEMVRTTFSHLDSRDLLGEIHPRRRLDLKRRVDGVETWFEADWLTSLMEARDGRRNSNCLYMGENRKNPVGMGQIGNALAAATEEQSSRESLDNG